MIINRSGEEVTFVTGARIAVIFIIVRRLGIFFE